MKFKEIPGKVMESISNFTQKQAEARKRRLESPELQASLERMTTLFKNDIKNASGEGLAALWRLTLGAPLSALWEGTKELGGVISHNWSVKNPKNKISYGEVPAVAITELLTQYGKGTLNITKLVGHLGLALGRGSLLGGRYLIGK